MHECKQLTLVERRKLVTWVDNQKYIGIVKSYMQVPMPDTVNHAVGSQKRFR